MLVNIVIDSLLMWWDLIFFLALSFPIQQLHISCGASRTGNGPLSSGRERSYSSPCLIPHLSAATTGLPEVAWTASSPLPDYPCG